jgi:hypothetical protein
MQLLPPDITGRKARHQVIEMCQVPHLNVSPCTTTCSSSRTIQSIRRLCLFIQVRRFMHELLSSSVSDFHVSPNFLPSHASSTAIPHAASLRISCLNNPTNGLTTILTLGEQNATFSKTNVLPARVGNMYNTSRPDRMAPLQARGSFATPLVTSRKGLVPRAVN